MEWEHSYMQETKMPIKIPKLSYIKPWIVLCFTILAFKAYIACNVFFLNFCVAFLIPKIL